MADYRVQLVGTVVNGDPGADHIVNVLHYAAPTTTAAALGAAVAAAFHAGVYATFYSITVNVYDTANPLHSPPVYTTTVAGTGAITPGPRQVALCLSFYSGLNIKGQRGRIFVGPWDTSNMLQYASSGVLTLMSTLATALQHPGGSDVIHQIWHPKSATWSNVSNYFINNRWDTMRSRLGKETNRVHVP